MKYFLLIFNTFLLLNWEIYAQCTADAGGSQIVCEDVNSVQLNGTVGLDADSIFWTTSGSGTFSDPSDLNATYTPSAGDIMSGVVILTLETIGCGPVSDNLTLTITPAPVTNAGPDQTICAGGTVSLNGSVSVATGGEWSTSGTGIFSPDPNDLNASYTPSAMDIDSGWVTITLTSTGNGTCNAVSDNMNIIITPAPATDAGPDQTICAGGTVSLNGSVTVASGGEWSTSGSGIFSPDPNDLNATYTPSAMDIDSGWVTITLTSTGNGACNAAYDNVTITITPAPAVNAGPDQTICAGGTVSLNGSVTVATGGVWSSGIGTFSPSSNDLNAAYTPSASEIAGGTVTLTLTSTGNGACNAVSDNMNIIITPAPAVNAGPYQTICAGGTVSLNGSVTVATGGVWTSFGTGIFSPSPNDLNATYIPSASDIASGIDTLILTTTGTGTCNPASDHIKVTYSPVPTVNAGPNQSLSAGGVTLNGAITGAAGAIWSTSGTGIFSDSSSMNAVYTPSAGDLSAGNVTLTLTTVGNGACSAASDNMVLTSNPQVCNVSITTSIDNNKVVFSATNDDNTSVGAYFWNFGDGILAGGRVQTHIYASAGTYNASVFYITPDSSCSASKSSVITISSVAIPTYALSGVIRAGGNALDKGVVSLYKLNNSYYDLLIAKNISATDAGAYTFENLENGTYIVHALIDRSSTYSTTYTPAYFGNAGTWRSATIIQINNGSLSTVNIDLIQYVSSDATWNTGNDIIIGTLTFDSSTPLRTTSATENPVANALVRLYNSNDELLTYTYTDAFGNFKFENLIAGDYKITIEYAGGTTATLEVLVDGNPSTVSRVDSEIVKENVALGISNVNIKISNLNIYPNPVSSFLTIEFPLEVKGTSSVNIINSFGKLVYTETANVLSGEKLTLYVNDLTPGFYVIELSMGDQIFKGKFIK